MEKGGRRGEEKRRGYLLREGIPDALGANELDDGLVLAPGSEHVLPEWREAGGGEKRTRTRGRRRAHLNSSKSVEEKMVWPTTGVLLAW